MEGMSSRHLVVIDLTTHGDSAERPVKRRRTEPELSSSPLPESVSCYFKALDMGDAESADVVAKRCCLKKVMHDYVCLVMLAAEGATDAEVSKSLHRRLGKREAAEVTDRIDLRLPPGSSGNDWHTAAFERVTIATTDLEQLQHLPSIDWRADVPTHERVPLSAGQRA